VYLEKRLRLTPNTLIGIIVVLAIARGVLYLRTKQDPSQEARFKAVVEYLDSILIAGLTALFLINFIIRSFYIPSGSMEHTLEINDYILVNEWVYHFYKPARGDIIVFKPPPKAEAGDKDYIKRVVAVEGETVSMKDETVYIDGRPIDEPYKFIAQDLPGSGQWPPTKVPDGCVWVQGDNRHNSADSRIWGPLPVKDIIGKASVIFFPPSRIRHLQ
jgi:signal peptidase I